MTTFSVVATPIGNLEDITLRALSVLRVADLVLCEDTRVTRKLLDRHDIHVKTMSYHARSKLSRTEEIIGILRDSKTEDSTIEQSRDSNPHAGNKDRETSSFRADMNSVGKCIGRVENIALVSDAGTPGISDPGSELVGRIRSELKTEIENGQLKIEAIPGPSALAAALSIAGVPCADFTFLGFLPHKKGRQTLFREIAESDRTMIFYESPHRIMKTLEAMKEGTIEILKDLKIEQLNGGATKQSDDSAIEQANSSKSRKKITVCRELTKIFEEVVSGTADEVLYYFTLHPDKVRGEFVVIVSVK